MSILTGGSTIAGERESGLSATDALYEEVGGRLVEMPSQGPYAAYICSRFLGLVFGLVKGRNLGILTGKTLFVLDAENGLKRRPDIAFVSYERWPEGKPIPHVGIWDVIPDLAVEVISPNDLDFEVMRKLREYFKHGVRQVWQIRPMEGLVHVYDSPTSVTIHERSETMDCGPILGNVRLPLGSLFRDAGA